MLAGRLAARELLISEQADLWSLNTEEDYHERKVAPTNKLQRERVLDTASIGATDRLRQKSPPVVGFEIRHVSQPNPRNYRELNMARLDSVFLRVAAIFGIGLACLMVGLLALYRSQLFAERDERWLLIAFLPLVGAVIWLGLPRASALVEIIVTPIRRFDLRAVVVFALLALCGFLVVAWYVLEAFPNSGDEVAYVMQAQTYAQGRLWVETPPLIESFRLYHFFDIGQKWVSPYAPGWALILAPAAALGLPLWLVSPVLGATTLSLFFLLARRYVGRESAWLGVLLLGASSFFILNSASYFSHNLTALCGITFALFGLRYLERGEIWCAVLAGACVGLMGLARTQNAVIFVVPFAVTLATTPKRRMGLIWLGLGGAPFLGALLAYNNAVTGSPLLPVADAHKSEPIGRLSPRSLRETARHFADLYIWTSPVLVFGYMTAFFAALKRRRVDFPDWIMPATIVFFLFYSGSGGEQYGPRYYFEGWPFAILTILKVIDPILFGAERSTRTAAWVSSALIASLVFEIGYLPARFDQEHRVVVERQDVYAEAESAGLNNAIVIIASTVGTIRHMDPNDLVRNGLDISGQKVIYALDLGTRKNERLRAQFPGRAVYVYSNGRLQRAH